MGTSTPSQGAARNARSIKRRVLRTHAVRMTAFLVCSIVLRWSQQVNVQFNVRIQSSLTRMCGYAVIPRHLFARGGFPLLFTVHIQLWQEYICLAGR